jgi:hypothetical protein
MYANRIGIIVAAGGDGGDVEDDKRGEILHSIKSAAQKKWLLH